MPVKSMKLPASRNYFFDIHNKREKLTDSKNNNNGDKPNDIEDTNRMLFLYMKTNLRDEAIEIERLGSSNCNFQI